MSQPGAGVRREHESIQQKLAKRCPPHPEHMIVHFGTERGEIPRRVCTRCYATLPCQACGRELVGEPGDPCPLMRCEARLW